MTAKEQLRERIETLTEHEAERTLRLLDDLRDPLTVMLDDAPLDDEPSPKVKRSPSPRPRPTSLLVAPFRSTTCSVSSSDRRRRVARRAHARRPTRPPAA